MTLENAVQTENIFDPADRTLFRAVAGRLASGVAIITSIDGRGGKFGLTLTSVTSLSLDPPLFLACLDDSSETLGGVIASGGFCINYLSSGQRAVSDIFATKGPDKFARVPHRVRASGQIEIAGTLAVIDCVLERRIAAGDHSIIIGRPLAMRGDEGAPLIHYRGAYREIGAPVATVG